jgi:hypothetical protein
LKRYSKALKKQISPRLSKFINTNNMKRAVITMMDLNSTLTMMIMDRDLKGVTVLTNMSTAVSPASTIMKTTYLNHQAEWLKRRIQMRIWIPRTISMGHSVSSSSRR